MGMKTYVRPEDGYRIKVTEKAYNLFYRKQGFLPDEGVPEQGGEPAPKAEPDGTEEQGGEPGAESDAEETPAQSEGTVLESGADEVPKKGRSRKTPAGGQ
ncbi:MAG: hypothetical protein NC409_12585 [Clostridium sp.]|nr:hypothetical protein [Clostridium sp.]